MTTSQSYLTSVERMSARPYSNRKKTQQVERGGDPSVVGGHLPAAAWDPRRERTTTTLKKAPGFLKSLGGEPIGVSFTCKGNVEVKENGDAVASDVTCEEKSIPVTGGAVSAPVPVSSTPSESGIYVDSDDDFFLYDSDDGKVKTIRYDGDLDNEQDWNAFYKNAKTADENYSWNFLTEISMTVQERAEYMSKRLKPRNPSDSDMKEEIQGKINAGLDPKVIFLKFIKPRTRPNGNVWDSSDYAVFAAALRVKDMKYFNVKHEKGGRERTAERLANLWEKWKKEN